MADSLVFSPDPTCRMGYHRLFTTIVELPRIVLSELNTHRVISKSSASSRARPVNSVIDSLRTNPFIPDRFPLKHKGMQADAWVDPSDSRFGPWVAKWLEWLNFNVEKAYEVEMMGWSKQIANRPLEAFAMHKVILSATEWDNFIALRAHPDAQNEIKIAAELILQAMNRSIPRELKGGEWHLPFGDRLDLVLLEQLSQKMGIPVENLKRRILVARCARLSYANFNGKDDYEADVKLYEQLGKSGHWSPFEHIARAMTPEELFQYAHVTPDYTEYSWCGNFRGFISERKLEPRDIENRVEDRIKKVTF